jgi:hypothetical protein
VICRIADFTVEFKNTCAEFEENLSKYQCDATPQVVFSKTDDDIKEVEFRHDIPLEPLAIEKTIFYTKFIDWLPVDDTLFFHASLIEAHGVGVAFTALSGTGKTTHTFLWQRLLGDKMQIVNGDKPIIRFFDDIPYAYGSPWCGKENLSTNTKVPLKHICFIERSETNSCEEITPPEALNMGIFNQVLIPRNAGGAVVTLGLIDRLLKQCKLWKIKCNMDISAAEVAYKTIFGVK